MKYTIKKGRHFAGFRFPKFHNGPDKLEFTVIFDKSCLYKLNTVDDADVNKLRGITYVDTHTDSIRIGWGIDGNTDKIALYSYTYNKGVRNFIYIASCDFDKPIQISMIFNYDENSFYITMNPVYIENHLSKRIFYKEKFEYPKIKLGWYNGVFFGGTSKCPHNMKITILEN